MNRQRAKEISETPIMANVSYNGTPIYIQHVDDQKETARIFPLDFPDQEQEVSLNSLREDYH
ncbi:small acid-soluble spore protein H [Pontibacillus yanchengensis]|uniref:Small, acid-soluble spore protein H n=1 Tax=Pontibacillus yanchengensis TaxID=462910 RepID=A0A6I5A6N9_9BACI|nr:small acid-soluble spore protein H [Pontibacillus yanchengensis]MYL36070.1 small acid-soluble spore protein H [Pontibacillus yanchengensis]